MPRELVLVEDNPGDARLVGAMLKRGWTRNLNVHSFATLGEAVSHLETRGADCVLLDLSLPDSEGVEGVRRVASRFPALPVVVLSGINEEALVLECLHEGAQDYLFKGQADGELIGRAIPPPRARPRPRSSAGKRRTSEARVKRLLILLCSVAALGVGVGATVSAFSDEAANSGNSFQAASSFGSGLRVATGSYTGNGVDNRSMTAGFQPDVVIVKATNTQIGAIRTSSMSGDAAKPITGATALGADRIQSFGANGFTLGTNAQVNAGGTSYHWIAFKAVAGVMTVGSYTGNGAASRSITGAGYAPEYAAVLPTGARAANHRFAGMTRGFQFDNDTGSTTRVTALAADGFTVGNNADVNTNGSTYHYITFNEVAGSIRSASYTGDNTATRNLTGMGFQPDYAMIRANDTVTGRRGQHRPASQVDPNSLFYENQAAINTGIKSLLGDGFQVGNNTAVNANGTTYHYLGFKDSP